MTTVISLMWGNAWELYGKNFALTFELFWPADVDLIVAADRELPLTVGRTRLMSDIPGLKDFQDRHALSQRARGLDRGPKDIWKFDAVKWAPQALTPDFLVAGLPDGEVVAWLDADVVTHTPVPSGFVDELLAGSDLCHLGRGQKHSEIGFFAIRLSPVTRGFLKAYADIYRSDAVFNLREWHSAYAFTYCLEGLRSVGGRILDLTPGGKGHVWFQSRLCEYTDHLKGDRKRLGRSRERK